MILAGDIGGTKTHLAFFSEEKKIVSEDTFASKKYASLAEIVKEFTAKHRISVTKACFGIAGPIINGRCETPNLPWVIETSELQKELNTKSVWLLNDLLANAYGLTCLNEKEFFVLNAGDARAEGNQALVSAGTGLGEAGLYWDGKKHHPFSGEGGHADFAPRDEMEMELMRYLKEQFEHVSYERVLSGPGLYNIYRFLIDLGLEKASDEVTRAQAEGDPPKVIAELGLKKESAACQKALEWFVSIYGAEVGNAALKFLALGGIYIGGGIAPKILDALKSGAFMESFLNKGRFRTVLDKIPVKVILNPNTALLGAARFAEEQ